MWEQCNTNKYTMFIPENEEIRGWFKVSSNRKKVWNIQLWLLEELKKICKKHNIKYYADWGTMIWAIRHNWFIPWDDDMDIAMFRKDYEKFLKIAPKELPQYMKLCEYYLCFNRLVNINTAAFGEDNLWDKDYMWWIALDIFPIDYASRFWIINQIKSKILDFLRNILILKKFNRSINIVKSWKKIFVPLCKIIFNKCDYLKLYKIHEKLAKKVLFKWESVYLASFTNRFYPANVYNESHIWKFENTTICIPNWYDNYLKIAYWDYMTPVIREWWHNLYYSVNNSYIDVIKLFDKSKTNKENCSNCNLLFTLE